MGPGPPLVEKERTFLAYMTHTSCQADGNGYQAAKRMHCVGQRPVCSYLLCTSFVLFYTQETTFLKFSFPWALEYIGSSRSNTCWSVVGRVIIWV